MSGVTPGQAAREAFGELGADWYPGTPWDGLHEDLRAQWEAAAQAAIDAKPGSERVAELVTEGSELRAELAKVRNAAELFARIISASVLAMEAAAIEMRKGDTHAAMQWILNAMPDCWDGEPGTEWNGTETAQEWFDRQPSVQDEQPGPAVVTAGTEHPGEEARP